MPLPALSTALAGGVCPHAFSRPRAAAARGHRLARPAAPADVPALLRPPPRPPLLLRAPLRLPRPARLPPARPRLPGHLRRRARRALPLPVPPARLGTRHQRHRALPLRAARRL